MDRRDFLRGIVLSTAVPAATALIKLPSPEETALVTTNQPVIVPRTDLEYAPIDRGHMVFGQRDGKYHPLGFVVGFEQHREPDDATPFGSPTRVYVPGITSTYAIVQISGQLTVSMRGK